MDERSETASRHFFGQWKSSSFPLASAREIYRERTNLGDRPLSSSPQESTYRTLLKIYFHTPLKSISACVCMYTRGSQLTLGSGHRKQNEAKEKMS